MKIKYDKLTYDAFTKGDIFVKFHFYFLVLLKDKRT